MKTSKNRVCNLCKSAGKIFHKGKWWCGIDYYTSDGVCKNLGTRDETNNTRCRNNNDK